MARTFLEKSIENDDLIEIARHIKIDWEKVPPLGLTNVEIQNIKARHPENHEKQW